MSRGNAFVVAVGLVLVATGCTAGLSSPAVDTSHPVASGTGDPLLASYYGQKPAWTDCGDGFECAAIKVPLAYENPVADQIELSAIRLPAGVPSQRLGSLFLNPGGPGASGVDYGRAASQVVSARLRASYDVIGFDPRGVGRSSPIKCLSAKQTDRMLAVLGAPDATTDADAVAAEARSFGENCLKRSPKLTPNIGTASAAKDLDILRAVVGDSKLNYIGRSYGSFLGVTYAGMFPGNVGRFVFDGAIDSTLTLAQLARGQADGFQLALGRFVNDCPSHSDCPLPTGPGKGIGAIQGWLAQVAEQPMSRGDRLLTQPLAVTGIIGSLYHPVTGWPTLRVALGRAFQSDPGPMLRAVDEFTGRNPDGRYGGNAFDALYSVNCIDRDDRVDLSTTEGMAARWAVKAPTFGAYFAWGNLPCFTWPAPATDHPHKTRAEGSGPILVIGTKYDPATPYQWAESMAKSLSNAALLTWDADGHTAYRRGSECVDTAVDSFLESGDLPKSGTKC